MINKKIENNNNLILLIYLLFFFGYIIYSGFLTNGFKIILPVGWFFLTSLYGFPIVFLAKKRYTTKIINYKSIADTFFFLYLLVFVLQIINGYNDKKDIDIISGHIANILTLLTLYLIPIKLPDLNANKKLRYGFIFVYFSSLLILFINKDHIVNFWDLDINLNYQAIALCFFVISVNFLPFFASRLRFVFYLLSVICLSFIGARTELLGYLLAILVFEFFKFSFHLRMIVLIVLPLLLIFSSDIFEFLAQVSNQNDIKGISNLSTDDSWNERALYNIEGLKTIQENPLIGNYASYEQGRYMHNILSSWLDLGFFGFIFLLLSLLSSTYYLVKKALQFKNDKELLVALAFNIAVLIMVAFSKYHTYLLIGLALGYRLFISYKYKVIDANKIDK